VLRQRIEHSPAVANLLISPGVTNQLSISRMSGARDTRRGDKENGRDMQYVTTANSTTEMAFGVHGSSLAVLQRVRVARGNYPHFRESSVRVRPGF
jgi:hypothetical protein